MQSQADEEDVVPVNFSFVYFLGLLQDVRLVVFNCIVSCRSDVKYCIIYFP